MHRLATWAVSKSGKRRMVLNSTIYFWLTRSSDGELRQEKIIENSTLRIKTHITQPTGGGLVRILPHFILKPIRILFGLVRIREYYKLSRLFKTEAREGVVLQ